MDTANSRDKTDLNLISSDTGSDNVAKRRLVASASERFQESQSKNICR